jgi:hypothetical protein
LCCCCFVVIFVVHPSCKQTSVMICCDLSPISASLQPHLTTHDICSEFMRNEEKKMNDSHKCIEFCGDGKKVRSRWRLGCASHTSLTNSGKMETSVVAKQKCARQKSINNECVRVNFVGFDEQCRTAA